MKKLTIFIIAVAVLCISFTGCSSPSSDTPAAPQNDNAVEQQEAEEPEEPEEAPAAEEDPAQSESSGDTFVCDLFTCKYVSHSVVKNYDDEPTIEIILEYTNTKDDTSSFMYDGFIKAFQDGVQIDLTTMDYDYDDGLETDEMTEIRPGNTIQFSKHFKLSNETSAVEIEISEMFSFDTDNVLLLTLEI